MKIAIAGKGGSGKTTIAGTLARIMACNNMDGLVAIDGDSNPNLAMTLGIPKEKISSLPALPRSILKRVTDENGKARSVLAEPPDRIIEKHGVETPEGIRLLVMAAIDHAGAG